MQKSDLTNAIKKVFLEGLVENVTVTVADKELKVSKKSTDNSVLCQVSANTELPDGEFGIMNMASLLSLLGALSEDVQVQYRYYKNTPIGMVFNDKSIEANLLLGDATLEIFSKDEPKQKVEDFDVVIPLKKEILDRFLKSKKALSDAKIVAFVPNGDKVDIVINYDPNIENDRITITTDAQVNNPIDVCCFYTDPFQKLLNANTDFREASISIVGRGLMKINFKGEDYEATYFMHKLKLD